MQPEFSVRKVLYSFHVDSWRSGVLTRSDEGENLFAVFKKFLSSVKESLCEKGVAQSDKAGDR